MKPAKETEKLKMDNTKLAAVFEVERERERKKTKVAARVGWTDFI